MMFKRLTLLLTMCCSLFAHSGFCAELDWSTFKQRFMASDGRIIDTGNHNVSHTEGQGFSMLFAVAAKDKASFDRIWQWTNKYLRDRQTGLFYWRYNPVEANPIADKNNASDGDVMIAWALMKAAELWQDKSYQAESDKIIHALLKYTVVNFAGHQIMLPGRLGFRDSHALTLNPSYFIFPAWRAFAERTHLAQVWQLIDDAQTIMGQITWGRSDVPTDWVTLFSSGKTAPANKWPARVSYDAIRVPMYIKWDQPNNPLLARWQNWFERYPRTQTPAWENVLDGSVANYPMGGGLLAVRDLTMGQFGASSGKITPQDDYYSASLKLLSALAAQRF
ncbi:endoglucanase [Vibrio xiamenensis]|uniref:Glucanase n=1 Tax=Vibrio xiamenensis TaxID=861298 RepID=A0A1G8ET95_9VIBR|nr:glycosyl hydrolase family 8 [Vibrio xiamenensis]SDH73132.1 endoglucanase [Vibrio xiamenensis]